MSDIYLDYYSIGYADKEAAMQAYGAIIAEAKTELFQIFTYTDTGQVDEEGAAIIAANTDGKWYFNVRSSKALTGDWIMDPAPASPSVVWA